MGIYGVCIHACLNLPEPRFVSIMFWTHSFCIVGLNPLGYGVEPVGILGPKTYISCNCKYIFKISICIPAADYYQISINIMNIHENNISESTLKKRKYTP